MHLRQLTAQTILVDRHLSLADAVHVADGVSKIALTPSAIERCGAAHARLARLIAEQRHIYGITTGFGPLANRLVDPAEGALLQQNLVNHLATGIGPHFSWRQARAIVLARLMSILQGVSGASLPTVNALVALLNARFAPVIPSKGTVGASGDLTPLAHMVLCFQGQGEFLLPDERRVPATAALAEMALPALDLSQRDGLALVNGTSAMTGIAVLNALAMHRAIDWAVTLTAALAEVQSARVEAWDAMFSEVRPHPGQQSIVEDLRARVQGSKRLKAGRLCDRRLLGLVPATESLPGQDAYTLRCAPQIIGAVRDTAHWHDEIVVVELLSATDNPIFPDAPEAFALHGGNFMGQHVGLASDALANAVVVLAGLAERQVARVTDEALNQGLPAFLHRGAGGLNSGLMGAQVTATALLAEARSIGPASVHSISTNGANQDVVSMGTIAARHLSDKLTTLSQIQAILALAIVQAMDILDLFDPDLGFSRSAQGLRRMVRALSPALQTDRPLGREIELLSHALTRTDPPDP